MEIDRERGKIKKENQRYVGIGAKRKEKGSDTEQQKKKGIKDRKKDELQM